VFIQLVWRGVGGGNQGDPLGFKAPLLIGGATTSSIHTAVKIAPEYEGAAVYVPDASRAVSVASSLLSKADGGAYAARIRDEYTEARERRLAQQQVRKLISLADARANASDTDWDQIKPVIPKQLGIQVFNDYPLAELIDYIDWSPFFQTWEMKGRYPKILQDEVVGAEAIKLFNDAQAMLKQLVDEKWIQARAVIGLFPAARDGADDLTVFSDDSRKEVATHLHFIRQQMEKKGKEGNLCLADLIAPAESGAQDYIGAFAVTTGMGIETKLAEFKADHNDHSSILLQSLADRLAEALAERMHQRVRKEFWGYAADEQLSNAELIAEKYQGIRPAAGYPASPDHTEKALIWELLDAEKNTGISLTESYAMWPAASVSGLYFSHPASRYFGTGKIARDQIEDYAQRKGMSIEETERWLAPILGYK
ncbi:vitamin B12 dependent-methionine synthase activation domain-containing protein, partial [Pseudomonadota bacterium]